MSECKNGVCPTSPCCICICTKELVKSLTPEAKELLSKALKN